MVKYLTCTIILITVSLSITAQVNNIVDSISLYGKFSVHGAVFKNKLEFQENAPKLGVIIHRRVNPNTKVCGVLEYRYHIINGTEFNNDAATPADFINHPFEEIEAFVSRLAYVGVNHKKLGSITYGKQWGVYFDIASYTDRYTVFGGGAMGVYAVGTDGGWKGTGRADKSLIYRNSLGDFKLGMQSQLFGDYVNYGLSLQYQRNKLKFGLGYNCAQIQKEFRVYFRDIGNAITNIIAGAQYVNEKYNIGITAAFNDDEFTRLSEDKVVSFSALGVELFSSYRPSTKFEIQGGFNYMIDNNKNKLYNGKYRLFHLIGGLNYYLDRNTFFYTSFRLDNSNLLVGSKTNSVFLIGFTYNFTKLLD